MQAPTTKASPAPSKPVGVTELRGPPGTVPRDHVHLSTSSSISENLQARAAKRRHALRPPHNGAAAQPPTPQQRNHLRSYLLQFNRFTTTRTFINNSCDLLFRCRVLARLEQGYATFGSHTAIDERYTVLGSAGSGKYLIDNHRGTDPARINAKALAVTTVTCPPPSTSALKTHRRSR